MSPVERLSKSAAARVRASTVRLAAAGREGRRIARSLAQGTLLAAGIAATQIVLPEIDPRFRLFDPTLVDRLQAPITRHHE
jgi:hypothetical protein